MNNANAEASLSELSYNISEELYKSCLNSLKEANNIIIVTHQNPDGDAIGSCLAVYHFLNKINKKVEILLNSPFPYNLRFLNGIELVELFDEKLHKQAIIAADLILILDLNDSSRLKSLEDCISKSKAYKIVIDHHINPKPFADLYIVDTEASSTGEIVWKILSIEGTGLFDENIAEALYTAIMTDSGSFRFPRTDAELHRIIADLLELGADPVKVYEEVYNKIPFNTIRLLGLAFADMELFADGKLCVMTIPKEYFFRTGAKFEDVEDFVEKTLAVAGVKVGILFCEHYEREEIRISFRSKEDYNVRDLAVLFGGGGHVQAAGAKVYDKSLAELRNEVLEKAIGMFTK